MTENQTKAKEILEKSSVRPYARRVDVFIYDVNNPLPSGDCNDTFSDSLGNVIEHLYNISDNYIEFPDINSKLITQICYNNSKTINVIKKGTRQKLKVVFKSQPVKMVHWCIVESNLWS
jgi:hypothetical protein